MYQITNRQKDILELLIQNRHPFEIATILGISYAAVKSQLAALGDTCQVHGGGRTMMLGILYSTHPTQFCVRDGRGHARLLSKEFLDA